MNEIETVTSLFFLPAHILPPLPTSPTTTSNLTHHHSLPFLSPVVKIDLLAQHFRPGKPNYERLKVALTKNLPLKMDFLLAVGELGSAACTLVCTHLESVP